MRPKPFTLAIDWPELMRFKCTFTDPVPELTEQGWAKAGVDLFDGHTSSGPRRWS